MARPRGNNRQRGDVQAELARLGHLAETGAQAEECVTADARREVGDGELDVVDLWRGKCKFRGRVGDRGMGRRGEEMNRR